MTTPRDPDEILSAWLDEGPTRIPDQTRRAIAVAIPTTTQRRRGWTAPWRPHPMTSPIRITAVVVLALALIGGASLYSSGAIFGSPTATPAPSSGLASPPAPSDLASPMATSSPLGVTSTGTIVFLWRDPAGGADTAYAMSSDGTSMRKISTASGGSDCCLVLMPDGREVLMATDESGSQVLAIKRLDPAGFAEGPEDTKGLTLVPWAVSDGYDMAFEGSGPLPKQSGVWLSLVNGGGLVWGELRQITTHTGDGGDVPIAFSPDGKRLLFLRDDGSRGDLYVIGIDGKGLRKLNPGATTAVVQAPFFGRGAAWSPDGTRIAFIAAQPNAIGHAATVYLVDAGGGTPQPLTHGVWSTGLAWSPDGRWISFDTAETSGMHDLILVDPKDGSTKNLTSDVEAGVCCSTWSPDSRYILVQGTTSDDQSNDLYAVAADGSGAVKLTDRPGIYSSYAWGPVSAAP